MKNILKNRKGFTLVELLAVIVILALIMGIAAFSMQGVTENVRISSMKSSAISYLDGVRTSLLAIQDLKPGDYYFDGKILETDVESPWGGKFTYAESVGATGVTRGGDAGTLVCGTSGSFVRVNYKSSGIYDYDICLYDGVGNFVFANENTLVNSKEKTDYYKQDTAVNAKVCIASGKISNCTN